MRREIKKKLRKYRQALFYLVIIIVFAVVLSTLRRTEFYKEEVRMSYNGQPVVGKMYYETENTPFIIIVEEVPDGLFYKLLAYKLGNNGLTVLTVGGVNEDGINATVTFANKMTENKIYLVGHMGTSKMVLDYADKDLRVDDVILIAPQGGTASLVLENPSYYANIRAVKKYSMLPNLLITYDGLGIYLLNSISKMAQVIKDFTG